MRLEETIARRTRAARLALVAVAAALALVLTALVAPARAATTLAPPLAAKTYGLSSYYGPRCMPVASASTWHLGQDLDGRQGTRINAIADGVVLRAGAVSGLGQWVVLKHSVDGRTVSSLYGHVVDGDKYVKVGQRVKKGQRIADLGSTGTSTAPHLHLEVWLGTYGSGATHTDPLPYLKARGVNLSTGASWAASRTVPSSCTYYATTRVNFRASPSTGAAVLAVVPRAGKVTAKPGASSGEWRKVTYGSRTGWIHGAYLSPTRPSTAKTSYVTATVLNLRSKPTTSSTVLAKLARGTAVTHAGTASKGWLKVKVGSRTGYVSTAYLSSTKPR
ncbi:peptidoglycan DD-metalloendopeptidase family protein [Cellulosimicrobium marinum]|uniref:peptidoglycan DD-metalloendopeptidase family protein n=1 Tax=Cellulosimicrobium marinum TaxID=1638992 RepID=UPI001E2E66D4|nr:peptidoglycan DD-metalloendopeptidase family protein [Cellulosimicrobium marinum]MCB7135674.1 peptidoglycan DD-metalloendopeptidase family protein [Cellulosimicrobium marinum]